MKTPAGFQPGTLWSLWDMLSLPIGDLLKSNGRILTLHQGMLDLIATKDPRDHSCRFEQSDMDPHAPGCAHDIQRSLDPAARRAKSAAPQLTLTFSFRDSRAMCRHPHCAGLRRRTHRNIRLTRACSRARRGI